MVLDELILEYIYRALDAVNKLEANNIFEGSLIKFEQEKDMLDKTMKTNIVLHIRVSEVTILTPIVFNYTLC